MRKITKKPIRLALHEDDIPVLLRCIRYGRYSANQRDIKQSKKGAKLLRSIDNIKTRLLRELEEPLP